MKIIKLGLLSVLVFGLLFWGITLLFPSNTVISRALNIAADSGQLMRSVSANEISVQTLLSGNEKLVVKTADIPFYDDDLFNQQAGQQPIHADTLFFQIQQSAAVIANGGIAFYQLQKDSTTTQMFYVFQTPWYKPLLKMKMMMADKAYGPGLDSALKRCAIAWAQTKTDSTLHHP
ncbi:MAG: hypothetical protein IT252_01495 [Chitinophagaceae bacterium]|nr:hypothetical protein [Chitinophagaceae bacterium]